MNSVPEFGIPAFFQIDCQSVYYVLTLNKGDFSLNDFSHSDASRIQTVKDSNRLTQ